MTTQYALWLKGTVGKRVAQIAAFSSFKYTKKMNEPNAYELQMSAERDDDVDKIALFVLDAQLEAWRKPDDEDWYLDFEAFHRKYVEATDSNGEFLWTSTGVGYEDLLRRRQVIPVGDQYQTSGYAADIMKEMVRNEAADDAVDDRQMTGLTVGADDETGPYMEWQARYTPVLGECEKIVEAARALGTAVWFAVVGTGEATFEFQASAAPYGEDRRETVVFTQLLGNMVTPQHTEDRLSEKNFIYVGGSGGSSRLVREISDDTAVAASPWNRCEGFSNASAVETTDMLEDAGQKVLSEQGLEETFQFEVAEVSSCRYGVHWDVGDWVKARFFAEDVEMEIVSVSVSLTASGEEISAEFRLL